MKELVKIEAVTMCERAGRQYIALVMAGVVGEAEAHLCVNEVYLAIIIIMCPFGGNTQRNGK